METILGFHPFGSLTRPISTLDHYAESTHVLSHLFIPEILPTGNDRLGSGGAGDSGIIVAVVGDADAGGPPAATCYTFVDLFL